MVIDLEFSWQEVDNGEISGLMGGGGTKIGPFEISGISGGREASPGHAAGGKLQEILAGKEGARVCGTEGSVKSGGNILPNLLPLHLRLLLREMRELWEERARVALGYYAIFFFPMHLDIEEWTVDIGARVDSNMGNIYANFFSPCNHPRQHLLAAYF